MEGVTTNNLTSNTKTTAIFRYRHSLGQSVGNNSCLRQLLTRNFIFFFIASLIFSPAASAQAQTVGPSVTGGSGGNNLGTPLPVTAGTPGGTGPNPSSIPPFWLSIDTSNGAETIVFDPVGAGNTVYARLPGETEEQARLRYIQYFDWAAEFSRYNLTTEVWRTNYGGKSLYLITDTPLTTRGERKIIAIAALVSEINSSVTSGLTSKTYNGFNFYTFANQEQINSYITSGNGSEAFLGEFISRLPLTANFYYRWLRQKPYDTTSNASCTGSNYFYPYTHASQLAAATKSLQNVYLALKRDNSASQDIMTQINAFFSPVIDAEGNIKTGVTIEDVRSVVPQDLDEMMYKAVYNSRHDSLNPATQDWPDVAITERTLQLSIMGDADIKEGIKLLNTSPSFMTKIGLSIFDGIMRPFINGATFSTGLTNAQIRAIALGKVKLYWKANYVMRNNEFNKCLKSKNDPIWIVNDQIAEKVKLIAESTTIIDQNPSDDPCGCNAAYEQKGWADKFQITLTIRAVICSLECDLALFAKDRFNNAMETLQAVIGLRTAGK